MKTKLPTLALAICLFFNLLQVYGQRTICSSSLTLNVNGTSSNYSLKGSSPNQLAGFTIPLEADLGVLSTLSITFARHDINRSPTNPNCGVSPFVDDLQYRVYKMGDTPPSFSTLALVGGGSDVGICTAPNNFFKANTPTSPITLIPSNPICDATYIVEFKNFTSSNNNSSCTDETSVYATKFIYRNGKVAYNNVCYNNISAALNAATQGGEIFLLENIPSQDLTIASGQTLTITPNVNYLNTNTICNNGTINLMGNATFVNGLNGVFNGRSSFNGNFTNQSILQLGDCIPQGN